MSVKEYIKETRNEMKNVKWPTKRQTRDITLLVIGLSVVVAYFLGVFDLIYTTILKKLIF